MDERHQADAVDYTQADITPEDAHYFSETVNDADKCEICGKAVDDTLHKQAALAAYYLYKDDVDKKIAETQQYWAGKAARASSPRSRSPRRPRPSAWTGIEVRPDDLFERAAQSTRTMDTAVLAAPRHRGRRPADLLRRLHRRRPDDGGPALRQRRRDVLPASTRAADLGADRVWAARSRSTSWTTTPPRGGPGAVGLPRRAGRPARGRPRRGADDGGGRPRPRRRDGRPGLVVTAATPATPSPTTATPRRSARPTPSKQVRDAGGRFAKSGSKIAVGPQARPGTVTKIDPATQQVEVDVRRRRTRSGSPPRAPGWPSPRGAPPAPRADRPAQDRGRSRAPPRTRPRRCCPVDAAADGRRRAAARSSRTTRTSSRRSAPEPPPGRRRRRHGRRASARVRGEQEKAEADYQRRLETIHAQGKRRDGSTGSTARSCCRLQRQPQAAARLDRQGRRQAQERHGRSLLAAGTADHRPGPVRRRAGLHGRGGRGQPAGRAGAAGHGPGQHRGHRGAAAALHRDRLGQRPEDPAPAQVQLAARDRVPGRGHVQRHAGAGQGVLHHARGQGRGRGRGQGGRVPGRRGGRDLGRVRRADRRGHPRHRRHPERHRRDRDG